MTQDYLIRSSPEIVRKLYTSRASLAIFGLIIQQNEILSPIRNLLKIDQKTVKHSSTDKVFDVFIGILAGVNAVMEINTKLRPDEALQLCFGRKSCAEQSTIQTTLNTCNKNNVGQMIKATNKIFRENSLSIKHNYQKSLFVTDIDTTGLPCGKKGEGSLKGYQPIHGTSLIRYGRQMCRASSAQYQEVIVDRLYPGNIQLNHTAPWIIDDLENVLRLSKYKRTRTVLRMDSGGSTHLNDFMNRGYHVHSKEFFRTRTEHFALMVKKWVPDPENKGRELGWFNEDTGDYACPTRRIIVKWKSTKSEKQKYASIVSTLSPEHVTKLVRYPFSKPKNDSELLLSYSKLYDLRAGAIEIGFKEDKQGLGMAKRSKKRYAAQQMMMMLNCLSHNLVVWMRDLLISSNKSVRYCGIKRFRRDLFGISGEVHLDKNNSVVSILLNENSPMANDVVRGLQKFVFPIKLSVVR